MEAECCHIGWNRIQLNHPADWQPRVTGLYSLAFESHFQPQFQVRWQYGSCVGQQETLSRIFAGLMPVDMTADIGPHWRELALQFPGLSLLADEDDIISGGYFSDGLNQITVLFQTLSQTEASLQTTVSVLCSLAVVSRTAPIPWEFDSYCFSSPSGMELLSYRFDPGRTLMVFGDKQETIEICMLTAARQRLKNNSLSAILQTLTGLGNNIYQKSPQLCEQNSTPSTLRRWLLHFKRKQPFVRCVRYHDRIRDQLYCVQSRSRRYVSRQDFLQTNYLHGILPQETEHAATNTG